MRVFAGPNGSGKTTYLKGLLAEKRVQLGYYVNADDIEACLRRGEGVDFANYGLVLSEVDVQQFFQLSNFSPIKRQESDLWQKVHVSKNKLTTSAHIDSYLAADIAEMLRRALLNEGLSFTYETVMSHESKISFMQKAMQEGYKVYLYYIATEDPEININRVQLRVVQAGHSVDPSTVRNRYQKSLSLLKLAVKSSNRAFLFDNSGEEALLVAQIDEGSEIHPNLPSAKMPYWVSEYLIG